MAGNIDPNYWDVSDIIANDEYLRSIEENPPSYPTAYNLLITAQTLEEMFSMMMAEENRSAVYALTYPEILVLREKVNELYAAIEVPTADDDEYKEMLLETLMYLPNGEGSMDGDPGVLLQGSPLTQTSGELQTGTYYLESDTTLTQFLSVSSGNKVTLDLNGYALIGEGYDDGAGYSRNFVIVVSGADSELKIIDSNPTAAHLIDVDSDGVAHYPGSQKTIYGGLIYNKASGKGILVTTGEVVMYAGTITGCKGLIGAAITVSSTGVFVMTGGSLMHNFATSTVHGGGAIYAERANANGAGGIVNVTNCSIVNNHAQTYGGAILGYNVNVTDSEINYNTSGLHGGGIAIQGSTGALTISNSTITCNSTAGNGGGVYAFNTTVSDSNISYNSCGSIGGAMNILEGATEINISNTSFTGNTAGTAGGVFYRTGDAVISGCSFDGNTSDINGGGLYTYYGSLQISDTDFLNNSTNAWGGGLLNYNSTPCVVSNCKFTNNTGNLGGALFLGYGISGSIENNCEFSDNHATIHGGAIYIGEDLGMGTNIISINGATVSHNCADKSGGGLYLASGEEATIYDAVFTGNTAVDGGAIYADNAKLHIISATIQGNYAASYGGGICVNNSEITLGVDGCLYTSGEECHTVAPYTNLIHPKITDNRSPNGGGICVIGEASSVTQYCCYVRTNSSRNGQNILLDDGAFTFINGEIGVPYNTGLVVTGGTFSDQSEISVPNYRELHYHSVLVPNNHEAELVFNAHIPESKWAATVNGDGLYLEDCDESSPLWARFFPEYNFLSWTDDNVGDERAIHLYANWEVQ